jgi:hypothetical protein
VPYSHAAHTNQAPLVPSTPLEFLSAFSTTVCFAGTVLLSGGSKLLAVCRACRAKSESMIVSVASLHDGHCERNHAMVVPAFCFQHPVLPRP